MLIINNFSADDVTMNLFNSGKVDKDFALGYCATILYDRVKENDIRMVNDLIKGRSQLSPSALACVLWYAIAKHYDAIVSSLLNEEADINQEGIRESFYDPRMSLLTWAIYFRNQSALKLLLSKKINYRNFKQVAGHALHFALITENYDSALQLLNSDDVNINYKDENGNTALHIATHNEKFSCFNLILKYNPNVNVINDWGQNALHYAMLGPVDSATIVRMLINLGVPIDGLDIKHETPLHYALALRRNSMASVLLNNSANVNTISKNCVFPLFLSIASECAITVTAFILRNGANVNEKFYNNETVLHYACRKDLVRKVSMLLKYGADVNIFNAEGKLPLSLITNVQSRTAFTLVQHIAKLKHNSSFVCEENMKIIKENVILQNCFDLNCKFNKISEKK